MPTLGLVGAVLLLAGSGATSARAALPVRPPLRLYRLPSPLARANPGTIIQAVRLRSPRGFRLWVALYHSRSVHGKDIAVSGTFAIPSRARPSDGWPILSYGHGTTGFTDASAPSRTGDSGSPYRLRALIGRWVHAGYAVAATDYEGLGTPGQLPYAVGISAGRSVLDAARAARNLGRGTVGRRVVLVGHSEGGHAVLWADELARRYAPDLHVQGVVASSPAANLLGIARMTSLTPFTILDAMAVLEAWHNFYGRALGRVLTPAGIRAAQLIIADRIGQVQLGQLGTFFAANPADIQPWHRLAVANTPAELPRDVPIVMLVGSDDQEIPPATNLSFARELVRSGHRLELHVFRGAGHDGAFTRGQSVIAGFLARSARSEEPG